MNGSINKQYKEYSRLIWRSIRFGTKISAISISDYKLHIALFNDDVFFDPVFFYQILHRPAPPTSLMSPPPGRFCSNRLYYPSINLYLCDVIIWTTSFISVHNQNLSVDLTSNVWVISSSMLDITLCSKHLFLKFVVRMTKSFFN